MDRLVKEFIRKRSISVEMDLNEQLYNAIYLLEKSNELVNQYVKENTQKLSEAVPWSPMHDMYKRSYEYCCGAAGCFLIAHLPSSEALSRTALEGAVNLHFVSIGDSMGKQIAYFKKYLETERRQNENWKKSVQESNYPVDAKEHHFERINTKETSLDHYEDMLKRSLSLAGVNYDVSDMKWPSIFERFREIGDEVGYRTVYAALCSQAHNDAEDVLNSIMARVSANVQGLEDALFIEQYNFSLYMLLMVIKYHVVASAMYLGKFTIDVKDIISLFGEIEKNIILVMEQTPDLINDKISIS